ncbi:MAG TPA: hypothetical protein VND95_15650 [Stellaceae bacterium]|nr:hypothetical protein [Stellaceae bacterium]
MSDPRTEMHETYDQINAMWAEVDRPIADDDYRSGKVSEVIRWCRDQLGGRDQDLVPPDRWEQASREGWSERATYGPFFLPKPGQSFSRYVHDVAHDVYLMLPLSRDGSRNYDRHGVEHARVELELTELVVGWLADEANGINRSFPPLKRSRPPDLRRA